MQAARRQNLVVVTKDIVVAASIMDKKTAWILASSSSRRVQLLQSIGLEFTCISAHINEYKTPPEGQKPAWVAEQNAYLKAQYVANLYPQSYVIGADTIVVLNQSVFNKPKDIEDAQHMLEQLAGHTHQVMTAVAIICKRDHLEEKFIETTDVSFDSLKPAFIKEYLSTIFPLDKAGAYAIQHPLTQTFAHFAKNGYSNIMGFPIEKFSTYLREIKIIQK